jgi:hypothetical protein
MGRRREGEDGFKLAQARTIPGNWISMSIVASETKRVEAAIVQGCEESSCEG